MSGALKIGTGRAELPARHDAMLGILRHFRVLLGAMRAHYQVLADRSGLGGAEAWALAEIAEHPRLSVSELARRLALHLSTVSNIVGGLEAARLVARIRAGGDPRIVRLEATAEGRRALRRVPRPAEGVLQRALLALPGARLRVLQRDLEVLVSMIHAGPGLPADSTLGDLLSPPRKGGTARPQPPRKSRPTSGSSRSSRPGAARATRPATRT